MIELEAFVEIADTGNLLKASRGLGRTPGELHKAITSMEAKAGGRLFQRAGTLRMTRIAQRLYPQATKMVQSVREIRGKIGRLTGQS